MGESVDRSSTERSAASGVASPWTEADTETVVCCLCGVPGRQVYDLAPFGLVKCPVCELAFISPRLTSDALQRLYDEPAYFEGGVYGAQSKWSPAMVLQRTWTAGRLDRIAEESGATPGRLLEIGSGYGLFLAAARDRGYRVAGVELSRTGATHSQRNLDLDVFCGQLADAPVPDADKFDVICFWDTLEHVPDPLAFLQEVRSRLADDGIFALSVPYLSSLPARLLGRRWWTLKPEQHIWHYTPATLRLLAAKAGLSLTGIVTSPVSRSNVTRLDSLVALGRAVPGSSS
ncbi:SAM-dependent methyltransferase [Nakamurella sp. UYEF19]|uniref:class I SAM-dependent methyltransferase n=1 Tax=Nakamurella sp. UYEF19 TaxID=1756392 RepID=UPI003397E659